MTEDSQRKAMMSDIKAYTAVAKVVRGGFAVVQLETLHTPEDNRVLIQGFVMDVESLLVVSFSMDIDAIFAGFSPRDVYLHNEEQLRTVLESYLSESQGDGDGD